MNAWIGLTRIKTNPTFRWITAEPAPVPTTQPPWAPGAPSTNINSQCAALQLGEVRITDATCGNLYQFICECDAEPNDPAAYE